MKVVEKVRKMTMFLNNNYKVHLIVFR